MDKPCASVVKGVCSLVDVQTPVHRPSGVDVRPGIQNPCSTSGGEHDAVLSQPRRCGRRRSGCLLRIQRLGWATNVKNICFTCSSERMRNGSHEMKDMGMKTRGTKKGKSTKLTLIGITVFGISSVIRLYFFIRNRDVDTERIRHGAREHNEGRDREALRKALVEDVRSFLSRQTSTEKNFDCLTQLGGKLEIASKAVDQFLPFIHLDHKFNGTEFKRSFFRLKRRFRLAAVLRKGSFELAWDLHRWDHSPGIFSWARLSALGLKDILADASRQLEKIDHIQYPIVFVFNAKSGAGRETMAQASVVEAPVFSYCKAPGNGKHLLFPRYYMNEHKIWEHTGSSITALRPTGIS